MRKTYQLNLEGKNRDRLLEASKNDIRKYIRRERRKDLPEGADYWDFDMRFGVDEASAAPLPPAELIRAINALTSEGGDQYFVEILRKPGKRTPRVAGESDHGDELDFEQDQERLTKRSEQPSGGCGRRGGTGVYGGTCRFRAPAAPA